MPDPSTGSIFDAVDRGRILARLAALRPDGPRQWGKMDAAQMLAHCAVALELPMNEPARRQRFIGKLFAPLVRRKNLGEVPFPKSSPTDPKFVVSAPCEFASELSRLTSAVARFVERGPELAGRSVHTFFGPLSGEEWGRLVYKHLDHHLRQFSA
jgi:hypothetical protein